MKTKKQYAKDLLNFLNSAPTAFQATDALSAMLDASGAARLDEGAAWQIEKGKTYYFTKEGTQCAAFRITGDSIEAETELTLLYDNLQIELLRLKEGKIRERKLLSTVLDDLVLIPNNPHLGQTRIGTGTTLRDPYRSQFNYLWKSIETGIKSTLIGRHLKHDRPHRPSRKRF